MLKKVDLDKLEKIVNITAGYADCYDHEFTHNMGDLWSSEAMIVACLRPERIVAPITDAFETEEEWPVLKKYLKALKIAKTITVPKGYGKYLIKIRKDLSGCIRIIRKTEAELRKAGY